MAVLIDDDNARALLVSRYLRQFAPSILIKRYHGFAEVTLPDGVGGVDVVVIGGFIANEPSVRFVRSIPPAVPVILLSRDQPSRIREKPAIEFALSRPEQVGDSANAAIISGALAQATNYHDR